MIMYDFDSVGNAGLSQVEQSQLKGLLQTSVSQGTKKNYSTGWKKWLLYMDGREGRVKGDHFLDSLSNEEKEGRIAHFATYAYTVLGLRDEQITRAMTQVKYFFEANVKSVTAFKSAVVERAIQGTARNPIEERKWAVEKAEREKLPICVDMVWGVREDCWEKTGWDVKGMDLKALWLAIALGFDSGPRIGNVTKQDGPTGADHCIRARTVCFTVRDPVTKGERNLTAGPVLAEFLSRRDVKITDVLSARIQYITSKMVKKVRKEVQSVKIVERRTVEEGIFLEDLAMWAWKSGVKEDDEFLTRYNPENGLRKVVIRKDVRYLIKAVSTKWGLPEKYFSTKSLRSGCATHLKANGVSDEAVNVRGGWGINSQIPKKHYVRNVGGKGAFAYGKGDDGQAEFTVNHIRRMLPAETGSTTTTSTVVTRVSTRATGRKVGGV